MSYANQFKPWAPGDRVIKDFLYYDSRQAVSDIEELFTIDKRTHGSMDDMRRFIPGNNVCNQFIIRDGEDMFNDDLAHIDDILLGKYID